MVSNFFQLEPPLLCNLKTLDLQNSGFLLFHMQSIVNSMQLLEYLNIQGIAVPLTLNLSRLVSLKALDIDYFQGVTQVVRTIQSSCFYRLKIVNRWSKKNKKKTFFLDLENYEPIFNNMKRRDFLFHNCKINNKLPSWLLRKHKMRQLVIVQDSNFLQIIA